MDEYEIRQLYGRKVISKLDLDGWSIMKLESDDRDRFKFLFEAAIFNFGDVTEKDYKINVYFNNFHSSINLTWEANKRNYDYTWMENRRLKVSAVGTSPIFPDERINAIRFSFDIPAKSIRETLKEVTIEVKLLYPNGESIIEGDMEEIIKKMEESSEEIGKIGE